MRAFLANQVLEELLRSRLPKNRMKPFHNFLDHNISMRHNLLNSCLVGVLDMEIESYERAKLFVWIFFPIFIFLAIFQILTFFLYNGPLHPLSKILDGDEIENNGKRFIRNLPI